MLIKLKGVSVPLEGNKKYPLQ